MSEDKIFKLCKRLQLKTLNFLFVCSLMMAVIDFTGFNKPVRPNFKIYQIECYQNRMKIESKSISFQTMRKIFDESTSINNGEVVGWTWSGMQGINRESLGKLMKAEFIIMNLSKSGKKDKWMTFAFHSSNAKDRMYELWVLSVKAANNGDLRIFQALHSFICNPLEKPLVNCKKCNNHKHKDCSNKLFIKSTKLNVSGTSGRSRKSNGTCACGRAHYCSVHCQKLHWKLKHREECLNYIV